MLDSGAAAPRRWLMCRRPWSSRGRRGGRGVLGGGRLVSPVWAARQRGVVVVPAWRWRGCCAGVRGSVEVLVGVGRPRGSGGVADPGESLAGASWPAAVALVSVAFFLGGAVVVICASSSLGSRSPGESQDPGWIRRRRRLQRRFPSWGRRLGDLGPFCASCRLDVHGIAVGRCPAGGEVGVALRRVWQRRWWRAEPSRGLSF